MKYTAYYLRALSYWIEQHYMKTNKEAKVTNTKDNCHCHNPDWPLHRKPASSKQALIDGNITFGTFDRVEIA